MYSSRNNLLWTVVCRFSFFATIWEMARATMEAFVASKNPEDRKILAKAFIDGAAGTCERAVGEGEENRQSLEHDCLFCRFVRFMAKRGYREHEQIDQAIHTKRF